MKGVSGAASVKWALLAVILCIRVVDILSRDEMHPDEVYSVMIARCNPAFHKGIEPGSYSGERLIGELVASHPLARDIHELYADNHDVPHASLYYMLLRVALEGQDIWDPETIALRGGVLNLVFLVAAYLLLWRLVAMLTRGGPWLVAACCAVALLAPGAGECVVLLREYQLAMLGVVWYSYALFRLFSSADALTRRRLVARCFGLSLAVALCLSSGYLNCFWLVLMPVGCLVSLLAARRDERHASGIAMSAAWPFTMRVTLSSLCGLGVAWAMYAGYFNFLTRGSVHKSHAFADFGASLVTALTRDVVGEGLTMPMAVSLAVAVLVCICRRRKVYSCASDPYAARFLVLTAVSVLVCVVAVQYASLLRQARYSYPYLPMSCVLLPLCVGWVGSRARRVVCMCVTAGFVVSASVTSPRTDYGWRQQASSLSGGAVFHGLNANELPLLYPVLSPSSTYVVEDGGTPPDLGRGVTVTRFSPDPVPAGMHVSRAAGPLRITERSDTGS